MVVAAQLSVPCSGDIRLGKRIVRAACNKVLTRCEHDSANNFAGAQDWSDGERKPGTRNFYEDIRGEGEVFMLLRTISILIMGLISFALFLALSEIGDATGMPFPAQVSNR